jgi:glycosyltransferase involved in cell wall biosynthesis
VRVLHLIPTLGGGGAERQIGYLAQGLQARGCDVHVGFEHAGANLPRLLESGATVHRIRAAGNYDPLLVPRIVGLIRRVQPQVVQTWLTQMDVVGGIAARLTGTPWVLSERSTAAVYPRDLRHALRRSIGGLADAIVANSAGGLEYWPHVSAVKRIIPNALALQEIDAAPSDTVDGGEGKVILFVGRLDQEKNLPHLVDALAMVLRDRDAGVLFCGTGALEGDIRTRIEGHGLSQRIRLLGFSDRVWGLMKRADVLVSVSWLEGHPNVVLEAAACRCPLVLSDIPAHREIFDENAAVLVAPADPAAIASAIVRVLDDPTAAAVRARRAREIVEPLSVDSQAAAYLQIYERLDGAP